jgi:hypothetical protein
MRSKTVQNQGVFNESVLEEPDQSKTEHLLYVRVTPNLTPECGKVIDAGRVYFLNAVQSLCYATYDRSDTRVVNALCGLEVDCFFGSVFVPVQFSLDERTWNLDVKSLLSCTEPSTT